LDSLAWTSTHQILTTRTDVIASGKSVALLQNYVEHCHIIWRHNSRVAFAAWRWLECTRRHTRTALLCSAQQHLAPHATPQQSRVIAQAISLHPDLQVDLTRSIEAHLLQAGAELYVLGRGIKQLPDDVRSAVLLRHPRMDMKPQLCECMRTVVMQAPATRMGLYVKRFGFIGLIQNAPFQDAENPSTAQSERKL
jgi:hypothetical protein